MPKITPDELIAYTTFEEVKTRLTTHLENDIVEAEAEMVQMVGHDFSDELYIPLPEQVKLAYLKLAQFFALVNQNEAMNKGYQSEKIGDYSYTLRDGTTITKPDIEHLISNYRETVASNQRVSMRMRRL